MSADLDVVIIGAGAAGVAAARRLAESGLSALLLEAGQRVGGRAWTCDVAGLPLDLGCGWLHSADRNPWTGIAEASGFVVDRLPPAWRQQYRDLGFSRAEQAAAASAFAAWSGRLVTAPPPSDRAADALEPGGAWNAYLQAISGLISGAALEHISAADYLAYDVAATACNWRVSAGYGRLIAASLPATIPLRLATPVEAIALDRAGIGIATPAGSIAAGSVILTVSTAVLAGGAIRLPTALDAWRHAASCLPLGRDEKLFLEILGDSPFAPETQVIGDPRDARSGAYYIRPLVASHWGRMDRVGGAYSHALPGHSAARGDLARPFEDRLFFAGEATHRDDFSTAHGAYQSGIRAAEEAIAALAARQ